MLHLNEATLIGNAGGDPEVSPTRDGGKVARLRVATTERYTARDGEKVEQTEWHTVVAFGPHAEAAAGMVRKGMPVMVRGRIVPREWTDAEGAKRRATEIRVSGSRGMVNVLAPRPAGGDAGEEDAGEAAA